MQGHFQHFNISHDCVKQTMCGLEEGRKILQAEWSEMSRPWKVVLCLFHSCPTNWSFLLVSLTPHAAPGAE